MQKTGFTLRNKKVWIAGHNGMVGRALQKRLSAAACELLTVSRQELDLRRQQDVENWMKANRPDVVFLAAAKVGGILANRDEPAAFLYDNLMIEANVIHAAYQSNVEKLLFLGSSCIYPKEAQNPISEDALLSGPLEGTNEPYAVAKIAGIKLCQSYRRQYDCDFISAMPCNLYGPHDYYDAHRSHVIPALMMKFHQARLTGADSVEIWGSGTPRREFLFVDDLAEALIHLMQTYSGDAPVNIGVGTDVPISELAQMIAEVTGYEGRIIYDRSKPDGVMRKCMDITKIRALGWQPETPLKSGLQATYDWYQSYDRQADAA